MLSKLIRIILFSIVHLIITLYDICMHVKLTVLSRSKKRLLSKNASDIQLIVTNNAALIRKPNHLIVIYEEQYMCLTDVANIIIWSLIAGIPFISIYNRNGNLKHSEEKLFIEVEKKKHGIPGCIKWANQPQLNGYSDGHKPFITTVTLFCESDGRELFTNFISDLVNKKIKCPKQSREYLPNEIDTMLKLYYPQIPDPEVAIFCGKTCRTHGLPPWQIRLTEFIKMNTFDGINVVSFIDVLRRYSRCDQRFGK